MKTSIKLLVTTSLLIVSAMTSRAATIAADAGINYVNSSGTFGGGSAANLGYGFGAWSFPNGGGGGSYLGNGNGTTGLPENVTFGIYSSNDTGYSIAERDFGGGPLSIGQTVSANIGATSVDSGGYVGIQLMSGATVEFQLAFTGGGSSWYLNDGGSNFSTSLPFNTNTAVSFAFTVLSGTSYNVEVVEGSGTYVGNNYTMTSPNTISDLTGIQFVSADQGPTENVGFNDLSVIPEPSTWAMLGLGLSALVVFVRRRRYMA